MCEWKWEKTLDGTVRLLEVAGMPSELIIPEEIEGLPLTEVGPYCFAKNKFLERIVLPEHLCKIDKMAFYNCTGLTEIEIGQNLRELGADAFMNCHKLQKIKVRCNATERSGVRLILRQISADLRVHFVGNNRRALSGESSGEIVKAQGRESVLLFPEYYETYDEVTPAHLFGRNIEGEGFRARQCFKDGIFDYKQYDGIFIKACAEETEQTLCEMAMNRLRYPVGLTVEACETYSEYVREHLEVIYKNMASERDLSGIEFLCEQKLMTQVALEACIRFMASCEWAEGSAYVLRLKERYFPQKIKQNRYEFDDF